MIRDIGAHFAAKWEGTCKFCSLPWFEDDKIGFVDDDLVCYRCYATAIDDNEWERHVDDSS